MALALASIGIASAAGAQDVVYLNDGGEVRGAVMSRDPAAGVVVRQVDGTTRTVAERDVAYVGRPNTGGLFIDGAEPGKVTIQDEIEGRTPFEMKNLPAGTYRVEVEFDGGGTSETEVVLQVGRVARAKLELPESRKLPPGGVLFGGTASVTMDEYVGASFGPSVGGYTAISQNVEARFWLNLSLATVEGELGPALTVTAALHINLGVSYAMEVGLRAGALTIAEPEYVDFEDVADVGIEPAIGLYGSLATLRFGAKHNLELSLWHALDLLVDSGEGTFETGLAFTYLLL